MRRQRIKGTRTKESGDGGFAVIEAAVVFPIMFMVFLALVMLAIYLPQRAMLQRSTQLAATAIATEMGDTWIYFDSDTLSYGRYTKTSQLPGIYTALFNTNTGGLANKAVGIARKADEKENIPLIANGELTVSCEIINYAIYREIVVTSTRAIKIPVDFSAISFPDTLEMSVTAKAVVKDGDDFVRNVDLGVSFLAWLNQQCGGYDMLDAFGSNAVKALLGF